MDLDEQIGFGPYHGLKQITLTMDPTVPVPEAYALKP